jgi:hypothetical protein
MCFVFLVCLIAHCCDGNDNVCFCCCCHGILIRSIFSSFTAIPTEMALLTDLAIWGMEQGTLSSTIPSEIGTMTNLVFIDFDFNQLTGSLVGLFSVLFPPNAPVIVQCVYLTSFLTIVTPNLSFTANGASVVDRFDTIGPQR